MVLKDQVNIIVQAVCRQSAVQGGIMMALHVDKEGESCKGKPLILMKLSLETQPLLENPVRKNTY